MSLYRVHSGTENAFQTGEGGILLSMPWDINRQQQLSANPVGTTLAHRCKNGGIWGSWIPIANATPPQVFDLPLAEGFSDAGGGYSIYWKDPFNQVHVVVIVATSASIGDGTSVATLPEGFRPSKTIVVNGGVAYDTARKGGITLNFTTDGNILYFGDITSVGCMIFGDATFVAAT